MASITCFPKAILANKKRSEAFSKTVFDLNVYQNPTYISHK
jgi:hypothetical protein